MLNKREREKKFPQHTMDPMLQHLLEMNIQPQAVTHKLVQSLCMARQELLVLKKKPCSGALVPLLHPCQDTQHLLTNLCIEDDVEAYLETFEWVALCKHWEEEAWAQILAPFLWGKHSRPTTPSLWPKQWIIKY